jgi:hypothetical protein
MRPRPLLIYYIHQQPVWYIKHITFTLPLGHQEVVWMLLARLLQAENKSDLAILHLRHWCMVFKLSSDISATFLHSGLQNSGRSSDHSTSWICFYCSLRNFPAFQIPLGFKNELLRPQQIGCRIGAKTVPVVSSFRGFPWSYVSDFGPHISCLTTMMDLSYAVLLLCILATNLSRLWHGFLWVYHLIPAWHNTRLVSYFNREGRL